MGVKVGGVVGLLLVSELELYDVKSRSNDHKAKQNNCKEMQKGNKVAQNNHIIKKINYKDTKWCKKSCLIVCIFHRCLRRLLSCRTGEGPFTCTDSHCLIMCQWL